ncbi:MAG: dihydroorotate dehydrogenase [Nitrospirae bacterium]|nr:dihydroorotate dehydrogenase [Nitrospirota bacterium]
MKSEPNISVDIAGIKMRCPVMVASGTFGYGEEYADLLDLSRLGALVAKGITLNPRQGNPPPRIVETPAGMLNAIGWENVGLQVFLEEKLPFLKRFNTPLIVNVCGKKEEEYVQIAERLDDREGVAGLELNISCPNVRSGGLSFGREAGATQKLVAGVRRVTKLPLIVKLSPNVTDIVSIGRAAQDAGADGLSLINTLVGIAVDIKTKRPKLTNITGGLSGPAIKPVALRSVWEVAGKVDLPIIGMGGIMTGEDAVEFLLAGATAVAVGTANFVNPHAALDVAEGIREYLEENKIQDVNSLREYGKKW